MGILAQVLAELYGLLGDLAAEAVEIIQESTGSGGLRKSEAGGLPNRTEDASVRCSHSRLRPLSTPAGPMRSTLVTRSAER
jgi:hypothetical protein